MPVGGTGALVPRVVREAPTAILLVVTNLVPLLGVAFGGWKLGSVMVLYWAENGIIGIATVARILLLTFRPIPEQPPNPARILGNLGTALFFCVHYGIFWVVHGVFVFAFFAGGIPLTDGNGSSPLPIGKGGIDPGAVATGLFGLALYHAMSFLFWDVHRGDARRSTVDAIVAAPYPRLIVLHLTIIVGAFIVSATGQPIAALAFLVVLKTILDLATHLFGKGIFRTSVVRAPRLPGQ